jgi:acetylornithine deacetylase/succinyl-diaminopimelate desuccinylase-like protein
LNKEAVHKYIDDHSEDFIKDLQEFCKHPAFAHDGTGIAGMAQRTLDLLEKRGIASEILPTSGHPVVVGVIKGKSDRSLLCYSHYDVLPPGPLDAWKFDPFSATIENGHIYARGISDHRGSLVSRIHAVEAIRATVGEPSCTLKFIIEGEEELGSRHLDEAVTRYFDKVKADASLYSGWWRDEQDRPRMNCGMRGSMRVSLTCRTSAQDLHGSYATLVPNPFVRLASAISTMVTADGDITIDGFNENVDPLTKEDIEALDSIPLVAEKFAERFGVKRLNGGVTGLEAKKRHVFSSVFSVSDFKTNAPGGTVPAEASCQIGISLVPKQHPDDILAKIQKHLQKRGFDDIQAKISRAGNLPARVPLTERIVGVVRDAATHVYGTPPSLVPMSSGSGPRWIFVNKGIPMVADPGVGWSGSADHAANENIRVDHYLQGIHVAAEIFLRF